MNDKMLAAVLYGREEVRMEHVDLPAIEKGDVLVRVRAALTCGTDVKVFRRGYHARMIVPPALFGHELAGDIVATGTNHRGLHSFMDGDRIELTVEKIGTLKVIVKDELKRTWARTTRLEHKEKGGEGPHTPQLTGKYAK